MFEDYEELTDEDVEELSPEDRKIFDKLYNEGNTYPVWIITKAGERKLKKRFCLTGSRPGASGTTYVQLECFEEDYDETLERIERWEKGGGLAVSDNCFWRS